MTGTTTADALRAGTHTIEVEGIAQRYHVAGTGPVCLTHSGGPGIGWEYLRMPALEQHLTMVYVEPIGTGESGRLADPSGYHLDTYSRFTHAVIEHLDAGAVHLLGHSHGGFVAQHYALAHPDRIAGLVLYDTSPVTGAEFWGSAVSNIQQFATAHAEAPGAAEIMPAFTSQHPGLNDAQLTEMLRTIFPAYVADYWGRAAEFAPLRQQIRIWQAPMLGVEPQPFDVRPRLAEITAPSLIVVGRHDFICGPTWARMLESGLPNAKLVEFENCGHLGHLEDPAQFTAAVTEFIG
ncbi:MAG TPA: alpha/beta hydrolase [Pseudonocardiaceae bacterium]|nr:alpha/beta hydrolase [Pseudonocardiaceae bacterium]